MSNEDENPENTEAENSETVDAADETQIVSADQEELAGEVLDVMAAGETEIEASSESEHDEAQGDDVSDDMEEEAASDDENTSNVTQLFPEDEAPHIRMLEALLFAASEPLTIKSLQDRLPAGLDVKDLINKLRAQYDKRGVNLICVGGRWAFRTAPDLAFLMEKEAVEQKRLSRAAIETLAIIAYHQPVTRAEIEDIRGVSVSKGTVDVLLEVGWIRPRGRKKTPGRPLLYGTSDSFSEHFGLENIKDLPGLSELKDAGLLSSNLPPDFKVPEPKEPSAEELADEEESMLGQKDEILNDNLNLDLDVGGEDGGSDEGNGPTADGNNDEVSFANEGTIAAQIQNLEAEFGAEPPPDPDLKTA